MPLSGRAIEILHDARRRSDGTGLLFRGPRGKPLSDMTLSNLIKGLGIAAVPHGFRSSFRTGPRNGRTYPAKWSRSHSPVWYKTPPRAAYARSDLFERRRHLMDEWAAYLSGGGGHVVADAGNHPSPSRFHPVS